LKIKTGTKRRNNTESSIGGGRKRKNKILEITRVRSVKRGISPIAAVHIGVDILNLIRSRDVIGDVTIRFAI